jgi:hypothetical protein
MMTLWVGGSSPSRLSVESLASVIGSRISVRLYLSNAAVPATRARVARSSRRIVLDEIVIAGIPAIGQGNRRFPDDDGIVVFITQAG